jgi:class 3 adenylate cyclase
MLGISKKKMVAGQNEFVVFCIRQNGISSICKSLTAEQLVRLLQHNVSVCENFVHDTGGSIASLIGECIFAAWNTADNPIAKMNYKRMAETLIHKVLDGHKMFKEDISKESNITISIATGLCVFERQGQKYGHIFGAPLSRAAIIAEKYSLESESAVLIEESSASNTQDLQLESIAQGIFKIKITDSSA